MTPIHRILKQLALEDFSCAMQTTHHRPHRAIQNVGDFFVRQVVHVGEQDGHAKLEEQLVKGTQNFIADDALEEILPSVWRNICLLLDREAFEQVIDLAAVKDLSLVLFSDIC